MSKNLFKIDDLIKAESTRLKDISTVLVDDATLEILNTYQEFLFKQKNIIRELKSYKEREIDAFAIGDAISDGICLVDRNGIVIAINKGYTGITGIKEKDIVGRNIQIFVEKGHFNIAVSSMVIEQKKKISVLSTINKNQKKLLVTGNPLFNEKGEVTQVLTVMRDLTELIKLRDKLGIAEKESEKYLNELNYYRSNHLMRSNLIGENVKIKKMKELIHYVSKTDATILIIGETGCGKEVVAKEIYNASNLKDSPYIKVNCAAIPDSLIESELFGYEKGAFTGAQNKEKLGMFEMANNGTILLDEISEMPINLQSKLLRVLQEKEIMRVGGTKSIKLEVRVIAATNQDLQELVHKGKFREDLFYRLNVVPIKIPPLRERKDDIPILAHNFLGKFNIKYGKDKSFEVMAIKALEGYDWPGNVRELENAIERLVVIDDEDSISYNSILSILDKDKAVVPSVNTKSLKDAVEALEKEIIENALKTHGSTYKAAKVLGITQPTVFRKAKALGIKLQKQ